MTLQFVFFVWNFYQIFSVESKRKVLLGETLTFWACDCDYLLRKHKFQWSKKGLHCKSAHCAISFRELHTGDGRLTPYEPVD